MDFSDNNMWRDLLLQATLILMTIFMFLYMYNIPQKYLSNFRLNRNNKSNFQAKRHFVKGAQLLSQAKKISQADRSKSISLAKLAEAEADLAISLDPKDAAVHILKALVLDLLGFKTSALDSINVALSPLAVKSLTGEEKADALFKRAELKLGVGRIDEVIGDLVESVKLKGDNVKVLCLLGDCYEKKGLTDEAQLAYEKARTIRPDFGPAREALDRLKNSGIDTQ